VVEQAEEDEELQFSGHRANQDADTVRGDL